MGKTTQVRRHGDDSRFEILAAFLCEYFGNNVKYIADIAGGQGILSRLLAKRYNYEPEAVNPRHYTLRGVSHRKALHTPDMAAQAQRGKPLIRRDAPLSLSRRASPVARPVAGSAAMERRSQLKSAPQSRYCGAFRLFLRGNQIFLWFTHYSY